MGIGHQSCRNDYVSKVQSPKRITATLGGQRCNRSGKRGPQEGCRAPALRNRSLTALGPGGGHKLLSFSVGQPQPHLFLLFLSPLEPNTGPSRWWVEGWIWGEVFLSRTEKSLAFFQELCCSLCCSPFVHLVTQKTQQSLPNSIRLGLPSGVHQAEPPCQQLKNPSELLSSTLLPGQDPRHSVDTCSQPSPVRNPAPSGNPSQRQASSKRSDSLLPPQSTWPSSQIQAPLHLTFR